MEKREISLPYQDSNPDCLTCKVVTILTELSWLSCTSLPLLITNFFFYFIEYHPINITSFPGRRSATLSSDPYLHYCNLAFNPLTPNDDYSGLTAPLTSKRCILYIYATNIGTEYFKHGIYSPFFPLQNVVCFINLIYLVPVLFTVYIQDVLKLKK